MKVTRFASNLSIVTLLTLAVTACGPGKSNDTGSSDDSSTSGGTSTGTGDGDGDGDGDTGSFLDTGDGDGDGDGDPLPNGETCTDDSECESGICYQNTLGSVCSECANAMDCMDAGSGINCTFNGMFFACSDGAAGEMCDDENSCMDGLFCSQVVNTGGLIPDKFCSECDTTANCTDPQVCNPVFVPDINMPMGQNVCTDPMSVALDAFCDFEGDGDVACESGHCVVADIMGLIMLGVCGECDTAQDCAMGEMCVDAMVDAQFNITGSRCQ